MRSENRASMSLSVLCRQSLSHHSLDRHVLARRGRVTAVHTQNEGFRAAIARRIPIILRIPNFDLPHRPFQTGCNNITSTVSPAVHSAACFVSCLPASSRCLTHVMKPNTNHASNNLATTFLKQTVFTTNVGANLPNAPLY